jgi:hypothetical protein
VSHPGLHHTNKECYHKGYKCSRVNTYLTAQLFAAPAAGTKVTQSEMYEQNWIIQEKKYEGEQLSIFSSIRNEIEENWDNTYMNAKHNPGCFKE